MSLAGQPNGQLAAVVRTANRFDYWVRRRVQTTDLSNLWPAEDLPHRSRMSGASHSKLFPLVIEAFGYQLETAFGPNMTLSRRRHPRISLHSSSNSKR